MKLAWYKRSSKQEQKAPWFIWLSFFGLMFIHGKHSFQYAASKTKYEDENLNRWLGYLARFVGLSFGVFAIPTLLMLYLIMERMSEPWYTIWNCIILAYAYFSGVFITWRLYLYLNRK